MLLATLLAVVIALYIDLPVLPILMAAAVMQSVLAYFLSKSSMALMQSAVMATLGVSHFLIFPAETTGSGSAPGVYDVLAGGAAIAIFASATVIGLFGFTGSRRSKYF